MNVDELKTFRNTLLKDNAEANRLFIETAYLVYDLCLKKLPDLKQQETKVTASLFATHGGTPITIFDKIDLKADVEIFIRDFQICLKNIYPGYNEIFEDRYRKGKNNVQIFTMHKMHKTSFYRFRNDAEKAMSGELLSLGYTMHTLTELHQLLKNPTKMN